MEYPKVRNLDAFPVMVAGKRAICLRDQSGIAEAPLFLPENIFFLVGLMNGGNSLLDLQAAYMRRFGDLFFKEEIQKLVEELDSHHFLDSERFRAHLGSLKEAFRSQPVRPPALAGKSYDPDPDKLSFQLDAFYDPPEGPGRPIPGASTGCLKGVISPHLDLKEAGPCYAFAYKEVAERCSADLFVILGTGHSEMERLFAATTKDFQTPLGTAKTDRELIDKIQRRYGHDLVEDEYAHRCEHSVEFQLIFIQHLFRGRRPFLILPFLCGSFFEIMMKGKSPSESAEVADFIHAVKDAVAEDGRQACFVAGADLAHIGLRYGDARPVDHLWLREIAELDLETLSHAEGLRPEEFFHSVARDGDRRRICGLSPIYATLKLMDATRGKLLKYGQWHDMAGGSAVTYASLSFE